MAQFDAAMAALAGPIARAATDRVVLPADPLLAKLGRSLGIARPGGETPEDEAVRAMSARLQADLGTGNATLIAVHGLEGRAAAEVIARLATDVRTDAPVDAGQGGGDGRARVRRADGPRRRPRLRRPHLRRRHARRCRAGRAGCGRGGARRQCRARTDRCDSPLGRCVSRRPGCLGAAALPRGRPLRPRPRRVEGVRASGVLARARHADGRGAAARFRSRLGAARGRRRRGGDRRSADEGAGGRRPGAAGRTLSGSARRLGHGAAPQK